ncbi:MAG: FliM/FliN family flagellar motor switch protein [Planctomycetaceae bacterium]|nr:FliM/FliN family flagellar motor switch protein [Planctomycetaceae bacterium]
MKNVDSPNLLSLISRMRSMASAEPPAPACEDVTWTKPHHYSGSQKETLAALGTKLSICVQKALQYYCDEGFAVKLDEVSEHFASLLAAEVKQARKNWFYLPVLLADKQHAGFLEVSFESAASLIGQMLRDPEAQIGQNGEVSALEQSILLDILQAILESIIEEMALYQVRLAKSDQIVYGEWPIRLSELEDMTRFCFSAECGSVKFSVGFCIRDEIIDLTVGIAAAGHGPEDIKKYPELVVGRMQNAPMEVSAQLCSGSMALQDILSLEEGDVLVLEQRVDEPVFVRVNGQNCFRAWLARHAGKAAVQMTTCE